MDVDLFDYALPPESIAQDPVEPRDAARLLVLDRAAGRMSDHLVRDLPELLDRGDLLVVNDTRVVPARLFGTKPRGARVELLLLARRAAAPDGHETWRALVGASRAPAPGTAIRLPEGFRAELLERPDASGSALVRIGGPGPVAQLVKSHGQAPLPPYIRRAPGDPRLAQDRERYQTVFAAKDGAVAAPTAGLHFTAALQEQLRRRGVGWATLTLHVGEATFRPVRAETVEAVKLPSEDFDVPAATSAAIAAVRSRGGRVVAVGTTVVRALESRPEQADTSPRPGAGATRLFIAPGHEFRFVDALVTNFHLPRSTLLMLVAAFAGRERVLEAYREALARGYRFFSYGDAMLIV